MPVLAVVVGVSVTVFSSVLLGTVTSGVEAAAAHRVGADASVAGTPLTRTARRDRDVPGVDAIAPVYSPRGTSVSIDGRERTSTLVVVDVAEMRAVQDGRADATPLPAALAEPIDADGVPVLVSSDFASRDDGEGADEG